MAARAIGVLELWYFVVVDFVSETCRSGIYRELFYVLYSLAFYRVRLLVNILSKNTNKMQLCNRIYCSKVYWRLNMFRAAVAKATAGRHMSI